MYKPCLPNTLKMPNIALDDMKRDSPHTVLLRFHSHFNCPFILTPPPPFPKTKRLLAIHVHVHCTGGRPITLQYQYRKHNKLETKVRYNCISWEHITSLKVYQRTYHDRQIHVSIHVQLLPPWSHNCNTFSNKKASM